MFLNVLDGAGRQFCFVEAEILFVVGKKDEPFGIDGGYIFPGGVVGEDFTIDVALSDSPSYEETVLRPEVKDSYRIPLPFDRRPFFGQGFVATLLLGDFKICRNLYIASGGDPAA